MLVPVLALAVAVLAGCSTPGAAPPATTSTVELTALAPYEHIFVIVLENEDAATTWGTGSPARYLNSLRSNAHTAFVPNYYGVGHHSLDNYIAMVSGQAPNAKTQLDCQVFAPYTSSTLRSDGQVLGTGCVYPSTVPTVVNQLTAAHRTWRAYMDGMATPCLRPRIGATDPYTHQTSATAYATKHNPFVYFRSISATACVSNDVPLTHLAADLDSVSTTRNLTYVVPDLCNDGHDSAATCAAYHRSGGGLAGADAWLRIWVPRILDSAAYKQDGLLLITFDEADSDSHACCAERPGPGAAVPGINGPGGGRVGALMMSPRIGRKTIMTGYNQYSLLATIEHVFGLPRLGYARTATPLA